MDRRPAAPYTDSMGRRGRLVGILTVVVLVLAGGISALLVTSPWSTAGSTQAAASTHYAVGMMTETLVDKSRTTAANGSAPELPQRTLVTTILYPAVGSSTAAAQVGAPPARAGAPYPLIAFSHGSFSNPQQYLSLLSHWAAAGFVVVAPKFPLSSAGAAGGVDVGDVVNQPADVSFAITSILHASRSSSGPLAGLVDSNHIGAAGHSLGAITTVGLVSNTCCKDPRVKAAVVMAGTTQGYPGGHYELAKSPPLLVISGTQDDIVPYNQAVSVFNQARGPKSMLTISGGDHGSSGALEPASSASVEKATTDFFDLFLRGDAGAGGRLRNDGSGPSKLVFASAPGSRLAIAPLPTPKLQLHATATPEAGLTNGETVTVTWSGYTPGKNISILECGPENSQLDDSAACDFLHADLLKPNPTGAGSLPLVITEGKVGNAICDTTHPGCFILVDNASSTVPADNVFLPISFAG